MDLLAIVSTQLFLLFHFPTPKRLLQVSGPIFAADHETDLAGRVGGNGGVGIFDRREDFLARFLKGFDQFEVKPLILSYPVEENISDKIHAFKPTD